MINWHYKIEPISKYGLIVYRGYLLHHGSVTAIVTQWSHAGVLTQLKREYNKQRNGGY